MTVKAVFDVHLKDKNEIYKADMPFINSGGIFVKSHQVVEMNDRVGINLRLGDEPEIHNLVGQVVWITPPAAQGGRPSGFGVQFQGEISKAVQKKIQTYLAGSENSDRPKDTM